MVTLSGLFAKKVNRLERTLAMLADEVIKFYPAVWQDLFDPKSSLFAFAAGHDLGAKCDLHLRPRPDIEIFLLFG